MACQGLVWYGLNFGIIYSKMFPGEVGRMSGNFFYQYRPQRTQFIFMNVTLNSRAKK